MLNKRYIFGTIILLGSTLNAYGDESALLEKSRQITADYATQLQAALQSAMSNGGPVEAISVCAELAPQIASDLSRASGAKVRRTSLRFRNPGNAPDSWEASALEQLSEADAPEIFEPGAFGGARYAKSIPTAPVCLACHGEPLAPEIDAELSEAYPHDRARGFEVGDLRGAFTVSWPAGPNQDSDQPK